MSLYNTLIHFTKLYLEQYPSRIIHWRPSYAYVYLRTQFENCNIVLIIPIYQLYILLLFQKVDILTWKQIQDSLIQFNTLEICRHLLSLCHPDINILKKQPNTIYIEDTDTFTFNTQFYSDLSIYIVPLLAPLNSDILVGNNSELNVSNTTTNSTNNNSKNIHKISNEISKESLKYVVDAAIMRVVKHNAPIEHDTLIERLQENTSYDNSFINKRIENLLTRDEIIRSKDSPYIYELA